MGPDSSPDSPDAEPVEPLYRDAPLMPIGEGTNDVLRNVVAKSLLAGKVMIG